MISVKLVSNVKLVRCPTFYPSVMSPSPFWLKGVSIYDVRSGWEGVRGVPKKQTKGTKSADL